MNKLQKSLGLLFPAMRISFALALLTACILLSADMLGFTLDEDAQALQSRKQIAESLSGLSRSAIHRFCPQEFAPKPDGPYSSPRIIRDSGRVMAMMIQPLLTYWCRY